MSHTPGPWTTRETTEDRVEVISNMHFPAGTLGAYTIVATIADDDETAWADARLVAAAPELLEALRGMLDKLGPDYELLLSPHKQNARALLARLQEPEEG